MGVLGVSGVLSGLGVAGGLGVRVVGLVVLEFGFRGEGLSVWGLGLCGRGRTMRRPNHKLRQGIYMSYSLNSLNRGHVGD